MSVKSGPERGVSEAGPGSERTCVCGKALDAHRRGYFCADGSGQFHAASDTQEAGEAVGSGDPPQPSSDSESPRQRREDPSLTAGRHDSERVSTPSPALSTEDRERLDTDYVEKRIARIRSDLAAEDDGTDQNDDKRWLLFRLDRLCIENGALVRLGNDYMEESHRQGQAKIAAEAERDRLREVLRACWPYMGHRQGCRYGADGPDGDFCTCGVAKCKRGIRAALSEPHGGENG